MKDIYYLLTTLIFFIFLCFSNGKSLHWVNSRAERLSEINDRPIIGVFAQPSDFSEIYPTNEYSYIASSYIKYIESAGARAVPVPYDLPYDRLKELFGSLNGIIFPGGSALLWDNDTTHAAMSNFTLSAQYLMQLAIEANEKGDYFPVWGTCLGYELILIAMTNDKDILERFNSSNHILKLEYRSEETRIFRKLDKNLKYYSENVDSMYFNHHYGISPQRFIANPILNELFFISSVSHTDNGTEFVASIEAKKYPFYGIQFHPEKSAFEWKKSINASHTAEAIEIAQELGRFFVDETRRNFHSFESEIEAENHTIYNFNPVKVKTSFMECYFFKKQINSVKS